LAAEIVEVGCIGLCSEEPILDVQLPGKTRISFGKVTADLVPRLLDEIFSGTACDEFVLGQFRHGSLASWPDVPFLDEHPFLRNQRRWVLANSGIVDPGDIEEYVARGGFVALAMTLSSHTPEEVCDIV